MLKESNFKIGDSVVYPTHGVGKITAEEEKEYGGIEVKLYVITFDSSRMTLRIPKSKANNGELRHLNSSEFLDKALNVLTNKKVKLHRGMWSKRVQKYESKINSGDVIAIAEVIRELHCNIEKEERSYSERIIYNNAIERLAGEYAATCNINLDEAINKINDKLN